MSDRKGIWIDGARWDSEEECRADPACAQRAGRFDGMDTAADDDAVEQTSMTTILVWVLFMAVVIYVARKLLAEVALALRPAPPAPTESARQQRAVERSGLLSGADAV